MAYDRRMNRSRRLRGVRVRSRPLAKGRLSVSGHPVLDSEQQPQEKESLMELERKCPLSTESERKRFLSVNNNDMEAAAQQLTAYLKWRDEFDMGATPQCDNDRADWAFASLLALTKAATCSQELTKTQKKRRSTEMSPLPQFVKAYKGKNLVLHVTPAQVDKTRASNATYALTLALYLDKKFDCNTMDQGTLLIDVRPGEGWPNPKVHKLWNFIKTVSSTLNQLFPGRLDLCIVYPIPSVAMYVWTLCQKLLSQSITERIVLVEGADATVKTPPPNEKLTEYIEKDLLEQIEADRIAAFI